MEVLAKDLRYALRSLCRNPGFFCAATLTLGLGIGANAALFTVFNAIILRPLPFRDPDSLTLVWQKRPSGQRNSVAPRVFYEWKRQAHSFEQLIGVSAASSNITGFGEPTQTIVAKASIGVFACLGVQPMLGRGFAQGDDRADSAGVVILSYKLWTSHFGSDPQTLGRTIAMNGEPHTIIGVLPPDFEIITSALQAWTPLVVDANASSPAGTMVVLGRLKRGTSIERANGEMQIISSRLQKQFPDTNKGWGALVTSLNDFVVGDVRPALWALLGAACFVLLIACGNVANLLLARSAARSREFAVRAALGGDRARLLRQVLTETLVLGLAGGGAGLLFAYGGLKLLLLSGSKLPRTNGIYLNVTVLAFTFLLSVVTGLLFGLLMARRILGGNLSAKLRDAGRNAVSFAGGRKSRNLLAISEIALSLVLLIGAALLAKTFLTLQSADRGFSPDRLLTFRLTFPASRYPGDADLVSYERRLLDGIRSTPGVDAAGTNSYLPIDSQRSLGMYFSTEGSPPLTGSQRPIAATNLVDPGYFTTVRLPILKGRGFDERDGVQGPPVAIVSAALERHFFVGVNSIGKHVIVGMPGKRNSEVPREIVGVVGDIRYPTMTPDDSIEIYLPAAQTPWRTLAFVVRASRNPNAVVPSIRSAIRSADREQPIADLGTMEERIAETTAGTRWNSLASALFAGLALVLAMVGIYGVISYSTARRTKEIGVRMALGAQGEDITRWIVREAAVMALAGIGLGLAGYFALARVLRRLLYGTSAMDPATIAGAAALLATIAILASYIPARRAARIDPNHALREE